MMETKTILLICAALLATGCRSRREVVTYERRSDSTALVIQSRTATLDRESWTQTIILRPDTSGRLVPVEVTVTQSKETTKEHTQQADTTLVKTEVDERTEEQTETQMTAGTVATAFDEIIARLAFAALILAVVCLCSDKIARIWKLKN